jgi:uncharacterized protein YdeI (YjbR/CyaY-like superfamily)
VWLVFAKTHTKIPSPSYEEAVEEALCFGWIDGLIKSIDDGFHMRAFTPRKPRSFWSPSNRARAARLMKAGLMTGAGLAAVRLAQKAGTWNARDLQASSVPPEMADALDARPEARRNWRSYSESARRMFLYSVQDAKRPETRKRRIRRVVDLVARGISMAEITRAAMAGKRANAVQIAKTPRNRTPR